MHVITNVFHDSETNHASWIIFVGDLGFVHPITGWKEETTREEAELLAVAIGLKFHVDTSGAKNHPVTVLVQDDKLAEKLNGLTSAPLIGKHKELLGRIALRKSQLDVTFTTTAYGDDVLQFLLRANLPPDVLGI